MSGVTAGEGVAIAAVSIGASVFTIFLLKQFFPALLTVQQPVPVRPVVMPPANAFLDSPARGLGPILV